MRCLMALGRIREPAGAVLEGSVTVELNVCRFMANFDLVRRKGTLVSVGNASGAVDPIPPLKLSAKNLKLVRPRYVLPLPLRSSSLEH